MFIGMGMPIPDLANLPGVSRPGGGSSAQTIEQIANIYSYEFDGAGSSFTINDDTTSIWGGGQSAFSYSAWLKFNSFGNQDGFITKRIDNNNRMAIKLNFTSPYKGLLVLIADGSLAYLEWRDIFTSTGVWYHLAVTYDGSQAAADRVVVYVDGTNVGAANGSNSGTIPATTPNLGNIPIELGTDEAVGAGRLFNGYMDEVSIFSRTLSQEDITLIYNATTSGMTADLSTLSTGAPVAWYRMGD